MGELEVEREIGASYLCIKKSLKENLISPKELKTVLQCLGLSPSDDNVENIFKGEISFSEYCNIAKSFPEFSEEYINALFSNCIPVKCGKIKMTDFVGAFGPLSRVPNNGNSFVPTDANFSNDDSINLTSVISNISKIINELKELSIQKYNTVTAENRTTPNKGATIAEINHQSVGKGEVPSQSIMLKGSFFIENDVIISHQYSFTVSCTQDYELVIKQKNLSNACNDASAFLFKEENGQRSYLNHTNNFTKESYPLCTCTLTKGKYIIVPYSSGCFIKKDSVIKEEIKLLKFKKNVTLTNKFVDILKEIFNQVDLDGNNLLSRQEFNLYNWRTSGDIVEDEEWQAVLDNFDVVNGELSPTGFISLHQLEAEDCNGKTDDLWLALESMGYDKQGNQEQASHFEISLSCTSEKPNLIVSGLRSGGALLENAFILSIIDITAPSTIANNKDILVYKNINPHKGTIIIKNISNKSYVLRIDCSNSINCISHRGDLNLLFEIGKHDTVIAHHLFRKNKNIKLKIISRESIQS